MGAKPSRPWRIWGPIRPGRDEYEGQVVQAVTNMGAKASRPWRIWGPSRPGRYEFRAKLSRPSRIWLPNPPGRHEYDCQTFQAVTNMIAKPSRSSRIWGPNPPGRHECEGQTKAFYSSRPGSAWDFTHLRLIFMNDSFIKCVSSILKYSRNVLITEENE